MGDMKINPENVDNIIKALEKDFERKEARVIKKFGGSKEQLLDNEAAAIRKRSERLFTEALPTGKGQRKDIGTHRVESKEILRDPTKKETLSDIDQIRSDFMKEEALKEEKQRESLKGRVSPGTPPKSK